MPSAPSQVSFSPLVDEVTTQLYLTNVFNNATRRSVLLDYLTSTGALTRDADGGKYIEQKARVGEFSGAYRTQGQQRTFSEKQQYVTYVLPYSNYEVTGLLYEEDIQFLQSKQAIVKVGKKLLMQMGEDLAKGLNRQLIQSNATSNTIAGVAAASTSPTPIFGLLSVFGYGSTAIGYNPDTQASTSSAVTAADREVLPNVSYCGVSTHPTNAISGVDGKLNESTSPVIANWSSTGWNTSASTTYRTNCLDVVSHLNVRLAGRDNDLTLAPNFGLQTLQMHELMKQALRSSQNQQLVLREMSQNPDQGTNIRMYIQYENIRIFPDTDCPTNCLFISTIKPEATFANIMPQTAMAGSESGPLGGEVNPIISVKQAWDIDAGAWKAVAKTFLNIGYNPRRQAMAYNFA